MKHLLPDGVETYWIKNMWDRTAFEKSHLGKKFINQRTLLAKAIFKYKPASILILCCGVGIETEEISKFNFAKKIIAVDINKESCRRTKELLKNQKKVTIVNMNVYDIEYCNMFDAVICQDALHHLGKQDLLLGIINKALKQNGIFIGDYFGKELFIRWEIQKYGVIRYLFINAKHHVSSFLSKLNILPAKFIEDGWIRTFLYTRKQVVDQLHKTGFKILDLVSDEWHFFVSQKL